MSNRTLILAVLALLGSHPAAAQLPDLAPYLSNDGAAEVALARTAAPRHVSDSATVLVLTRTGYVEAVRGTNGFSCLVLRSFMGRLTDPGAWNPRVRAPHCFNPPAVRTVLPEILARAGWILAGASAAEVHDRTLRGYAEHEYPMPAAGAMAIMLSREQYLVDRDPHWVPHLMLYYDRSQPAAVWGAGGDTYTVLDGSAGDPTAPVLTIIIPVRNWSDGTPALPETSH